MAKLFALEEADVMTDEVELEASPEAGEVADVQVDVESDVNEMNEVASGIEEGIGAADQLEDVQEVVEDAAENGGLDPVAAEAVRIAVEAICARVGANPKSIYPLYAIENFTSKSSRRANTYYALEGIGEFLKNLWERIKAALINLWNKVKEFWRKHFSTLGRSLKALEATKKKVSEMKGFPKYEEIEVPTSLKSIFPVKATLGPDEINRYYETLDAARKKIFDDFKLLNQIVKQANGTDVADGDIIKNLGDKFNEIKNAQGGYKIEFGGEKNPMPGGTYHYWIFKFEEETEKDEEEIEHTIYKLDVDEGSDKYTDGNNNATLEVANKDRLKSIIDQAIKFCKDLIKHRDSAERRAKDVNNALKKIDQQISNLTKDIDKEKDQKDYKEKRQKQVQAKNNLRAINLVLTKGPMIETKFMSYAYLYFRGVIYYANACMKHTKVS